MEASSVRDKKEYVFAPNSFEWNYKLLRSVVFYGYNSSGKSNLLTALALMKFGVLYSYSNPNLFKQSVEPFLLKTGNSESSSFFEVIFITNGRKYRYTFQIQKGCVISEALYYSEPKIRENSLFLRGVNGFILNKKWNKETGDIPESLTQNKNFVKDNVLFISALAGFEFPYTSDVIRWFEKIKIIESFHDTNFQNYTAEKMKDEMYKHNIRTIIKQANLGFEDVREKIVEQKSRKDEKFFKEFIAYMVDNEIISKHSYSISTRHVVRNDSDEKVGMIDFDLHKHESTGTRKFFGLLGVMLEAIIENKILLIDELDAQFHSTIFETIFTFFNNPQINVRGAQLIFTSHNLYLLKGKKIRRDQIYNVERQPDGSSEVKRLHGDDANVRSDASVEKLHTDKFPDLNFTLFTGKFDFPE